MSRMPHVCRIRACARLVTPNLHTYIRTYYTNKRYHDVHFVIYVIHTACVCVCSGICDSRDARTTRASAPTRQGEVRYAPR